MFVAAGVNRTKNKMLRLVPSLLGVVLVFVFLLLDIHAASAAPLSAIRVTPCARACSISAAVCFTAVCT